MQKIFRKEAIFQTSRICQATRKTKRTLTGIVYYVISTNWSKGSLADTKSRTYLCSSLVLGILFLTSCRKEDNVVYSLDEFQLNDALY